MAIDDNEDKLDVGLVIDPEPSTETEKGSELLLPLAVAALRRFLEQEPLFFVA